MRSAAIAFVASTLLACSGLGEGGSGAGADPTGKADGVCASDGGVCETDASSTPPAAPVGGASFVLVSATLPLANRRGTDWDTLSNGVERLPDPYFVLARSAAGAPESLVRTPSTRNSVAPVLEDPELDWVDDFGALEALRVEVLDDDGITAQFICVAELPLEGVVALPHRWEVACEGGALVVEARSIEGTIAP